MCYHAGASPGFPEHHRSPWPCTQLLLFPAPSPHSQWAPLPSPTPFPTLVLMIPSTRHHVQSPRERWRRDSESLWMNSVEWAMLPRRVVAVRTMTLSGLRVVPFCSYRESPGLLLRRRTQGRECPGSAEPLTWSLQSPALPFLLGQGSGRALTGRGSWRSVITGEGVGCWARAGSRVRSTWA